MKKLFLIAFITMTMASCGTYSYSSGVENKCGLSFVAATQTPITVTVDDQNYNVEAVKYKNYKRDRKIKKTAKNTIIVEPGKHDVKVVMNGNEVLSKTIFVSGNETKIIEL
ncbi:MAG: hypothetical protein Q4F69_02825 [Bacteroidia bacterium]|nr:hypothetical protein [Bacteroidia bacterium]